MQVKGKNKWTDEWKERKEEWKKQTRRKKCWNRDKGIEHELTRLRGAHIELLSAVQWFTGYNFIPRVRVHTDWRIKETKKRGLLKKKVLIFSRHIFIVDTYNIRPFALVSSCCENVKTSTRYNATAYIQMCRSKISNELCNTYNSTVAMKSNVSALLSRN